MAIDIRGFYHHVRHATFLRTFPSKRLFAILIDHGKAFAKKGTFMVESGRNREDC